MMNARINNGRRVGESFANKFSNHTIVETEGFFKFFSRKESFCWSIHFNVYMSIGDYFHQKCCLAAAIA